MNAQGTFAIHTLGCKLNFSESSTIARNLIDEGYARVSDYDRSDIFILNTCSVTDNADKKCREVVRRAIRTNPKVFVVVIGCYAQLKPKEISQIPGVDLVLGANDKFEIPQHLHSLDKKSEGTYINTHIKEVKSFIPGWSAGDRTRTFFKVQDGCDYFCSFCTIPLARGRSRSASIAETVKKMELLAQEGIKEVVLTGVNIGDFGKNHQQDFFGLIQELDKVSGIDRYRISSIEPNLLNQRIVDFVLSSTKFVPHFHIPLQSGSDKLLKAMRRRYDTSLYRRRIESILKKEPNCCIGVDVIVGFPGETNELFEETYNFLKDIGVSYLHVFSYSERPNTTAVRMEQTVPLEVRKERSARLRILSEKLKRKFYEKQQGGVRPVLFECDNQEGKMYGFTDNYIRVSHDYDPALRNTIQMVSLDKFQNSTLLEGAIQEAVSV